MSGSVQHLRGNSEEWLAYDAVVNDGEIALERAEGGYRMKIGDGVTPFSSLPYFGSRIISEEGEAVSVTLPSGADVRVGEVLSLTVALPEVIDGDYFATLSFDSGVLPTTVEYIMGDCLFSGLAPGDSIPVPQANTHYTLIFWFDGRLECHVRSVANVIE